MHPSNIYSHCQRHSNHKHQNPASLDPSAQMKNHENIQIDTSFIDMELQFVKSKRFLLENLPADTNFFLYAK